MGIFTHLFSGVWTDAAVFKWDDLLESHKLQLQRCFRVEVCSFLLSLFMAIHLVRNGKRENKVKNNACRLIQYGWMITVSSSFK
jgi:fumarate reductase subunit D